MTERHAPLGAPLFRVWMRMHSAMHPAMRRALLLPAALTLGVAPALGAQAQQAQGEPRGKAAYEQWCAGCHGESGAGDGEAAAYMLPRPRDFTRGVYQIRTTASGELPTDADIRRMIDEGMPGTAMPGWKGKLSEAERDDLVAYLKSFSTFFTGPAPTPIKVGSAPRRTAETIASGRAVYEKLECAKCHGAQARGDGPSAPTLADDWETPIRAADLTASWRFNGGSSVEEIYTRLRTGLDGTPMPTLSDALDGGIVTDEQLWHLAQYVRSLSPEEPPRVREVLRAELTANPLPTSPDDSVWNGVEPYWVPLVGQIVLNPRWFAPRVDGVTVQALHDGRRLVMRLTWNDPSRSPDPAWSEWTTQLVGAMANADSAPPMTQGPDRMVVQFPAMVPADVELPYFLGGSTRRPVHQWRWTSAPDTVETGSATAHGRFTAQGGAEVTHAASYADGQWRLLLARPLPSPDSTRIPALARGRAVPVAFHAADGSDGEDAVRGAISAWYTLHLDAPTPPRVFVAPVVMMLLTAGSGFMLVWRARRGARPGPDVKREET